ncbi:unnamed protein product [Phaeothamnion confervicola]
MLALSFLSCLQSSPPPRTHTRQINANRHCQGTSAFSKSSCKSAGFVEAMVLRGTSLHRGDFYLTEDRAIFADGTEFKADVIVACTGFRCDLSFIEETHPDLAAYGHNQRLLYKQIFHPQYGAEVAYFGLAQPAFGSTPPTAEMQGRLLAMVLSGEVALPSAEEMVAAAEVDRADWERRFGYDACKRRGLVDYQIYLDDLAGLIGVRPPLRKLFFTNFKMWYKIMLGPFTVHQYRLVGPHAKPERAAEVYARQPVGAPLESAITAAFLMAAKVLSLLGLRQFTPNNF